MANYNKRNTEYPGLIISRTASGAVTERRFVKNSGAQCSVRGEFAIGVSMDGADSGKSFAVCVDGIVLVTCAQKLVADAVVTTDAAGKAIPAVKNNYILGYCMVETEAGDLAPILLGSKKLELVRTTTTTTTTSTSSTTSTTTTTAP